MNHKSRRVAISIQSGPTSFDQIHALARGLAIGLTLFFLTGCPNPQPVYQDTIIPSTAEQTAIWNAFEQSAMQEPHPAVLDGSLRFGPEQDTRRVTYLLWSNGDLPLRLDIMAGMGTTAGQAQVVGQTLLIYLPTEQRAYLGTDAPDKGLAAIGLPLPLNLANLNAFLLGRYAEGLGNPYLLGALGVGSSGPIFAVKGHGEQSNLELSPEGKPLSWSFPPSSGNGWQIKFSYGEDGLPRRIDGALPASPLAQREEDYSFVLLVKTRQAKQTFSQADLHLSIPSGTPVYALDGNTDNLAWQIK